MSDRGQVLNRLFFQVTAERVRQDTKWGEQNCPNAPKDLATLGIQRVDDAQLETNEAAEQGRLTWAHIAIEELSEAIYAPTDAECRKELIQLAAVAFAWIECIDRRPPPPSPPKAVGA